MKIYRNRYYTKRRKEVAYSKIRQISVKRSLVIAS